MKTVIQIIFKIPGTIFRSLNTMRQTFSLLAFELGQWRSIKEKMAVNANGKPIPWYTYPAIEYLAGFDFKNCNVFEFGSGNSSLYWSERSLSVCSVEDNFEWYKIVESMRCSNQIVLHRADEDSYVRALSEQGKLFEIIVVDGNFRKPCVIEAIKNLAKGGMIVLDNSDRIIEKECGQLLRNQGFMQMDFSGFGPINGYCWSTSIFIETPSFLQRNFQGPNPIGGLKN